MTVHKILLIDPNQRFASTLSTFPGSSPFNVVSEGPDTGVAGELATGYKDIHLVLVVPKTSGEMDIDELRSLRQVCEGQKRPVIVIADLLSLPNIKAVMAAGASGYLLRETGRAAFENALLLALRGEKVVPTRIVEILAARLPLATRSISSSRASI